MAIAVTQMASVRRAVDGAGFVLAATAVSMEMWLV